MALAYTLATLIFTLLICKVIYGWIFSKKKLKGIPGPTGWPLVGNSFQIDALKPHTTFTEWNKIYGDIFKVKVFMDDVVVLNDYESIKEMFFSEACSNRPYSFRFHENSIKDMTDVIFHNYSAEWNERKKAVTKTVNAFGSSAMKIENISLESIDKLFSDIAKNTDQYTKSIDLKPFIHMCTAGIITTLFYGRKLEQSELLELLEIERGVINLENAAGLIAVLDLCPWLRFLPLKAIQDPLNDTKKMREWMQKKQVEVLASDGADEGILNVMKNFVNKVTNKPISPKELLGLAHNVILAGFMTTTTVLYALILILINHPEVQEKLYEEIQRATKGCCPQISDRPGMVYIRAVIQEALRYCSISPVTAPHLTGEDTFIQGKLIPKGTQILPNLWKIHHDEEYFEDPWKFKPERYLTSEGKMIASDHILMKHTMPFGSGKRVCPGESLGRQRVFLILANLIQRYKFIPEDDQNIPSCDPREYEGGVLLMPYSYKVKVLER